MQIDRPPDTQLPPEPRTVKKTGRVDRVNQRRQRDPQREPDEESSDDKRPPDGDHLIDEYA